MIEAKAGKGIGTKIEGSGTPLEQANDVMNIVGAVYNSFLMAHDVLGATLFKTVLRAVLSSPDGSIWQKRDSEGYAMRVPVKRDTPPRPRWGLCLKGV